MRKTINNIQENSHQAISWFFNRYSTIQKGMAWYIYSDEREEPTIKNTLSSKTLPQIWWRNQKLSRQAKVKRIQHHQTSFTANTKGTSLGRKHKRKKRSAQNKPKAIKKMVIGSYILIITLNVNGLNAPTKIHWQAGWMKDTLSLTTSFCLSPPQVVCNDFILLLIMFPL